MKITYFLDALIRHHIDFFTGVPDSLLQPLCDALYEHYGVKENNLIAANEGNCVGIAAGYYLATQKIPCVYLQNSGIGNSINPIVSLLNDQVYQIPILFVVGYRGEPGVKDEPQHVFQGEITCALFSILGVPYEIIDKQMNDTEFEKILIRCDQQFSEGKSVALIIKKDAFDCEKKSIYKNEYPLIREAVIQKIATAYEDAIFVSTTGKISRELFELREKNKQGHACDFLTVGSMGHSSSIALGIALQKKQTPVVCLDGDGAALMHLGAMAVIGHQAPKNLIHFILNNEAYETVGGTPSAAITTNFIDTAFSCGYQQAYSVNCLEDLMKCLEKSKQQEGPLLIEVKVSMQSRKDLMRPTMTPQQNKTAFMAFLERCL